MGDSLSHIHMSLGISQSTRSECHFVASFHTIFFCLWCFLLGTTELDFVMCGSFFVASLHTIFLSLVFSIKNN